MTETAEDPVDLLYEAARLCGFNASDGWPGEFEEQKFIVLMAGGGAGTHRDAWRIARQQVSDGIAAGTLKTRDVDQGFEEVEHDAANLTDAERFSKAVFPKHDRFIWYERRKKAPLRYITRDACRDWLHTIKKSPPRLVRAWLGETQSSEAPASITADDPTPKKQDAMSIELDSVRAGMKAAGERITPIAVMAKLKKLVDTKGSCVTEECPEGVLWMRDSGQTEKLTLRALEKRLNRRKTTR